MGSVLPGIENSLMSKRCNKKKLGYQTSYAIQPSRQLFDAAFYKNILLLCEGMDSRYDVCNFPSNWLCQLANSSLNTNNFSKLDFHNNVLLLFKWHFICVKQFPLNSESNSLLSSFAYCHKQTLAWCKISSYTESFDFKYFDFK